MTPCVGRFANRPGVFGALLSLGFVVVSLPVFLGVLNHDVGWWLYLAGRVLAGDRLYVDLIETNPPLNGWLNIAPIGVARLLGISEITALRLVVLGLVAGVLAMIAGVLRGSSTLRPALGIALLALIPAVGYDFAQREHLMLAMISPALWMASARASGRDFLGIFPIVVGILAGIGIALKPHFALAWLAVEIALVGSRRDWRMIVRPEAVMIVTVILAYAIVVAIGYPEYLEMIAWVRPLYAATGRASTGALLGQPATFLATLAILGYALRWSKGDGLGIFVAAVVGFLAVAFLQDKGYRYHFYPAFALAFSLIGLLVAKPAGRGMKVSNAFLTLAFVAASCGIAAGRVADCLCWRGDPVASDTPFGNLARLSGTQGENGGVFAFSTAMAAGFPLVNYRGQAWASRHFSLWFLPALYASDRGAGTIITRPKSAMDATERALFEAVVDDLISRRPALLLVDEASQKPAFGGKDFDYLAYYSDDPRFVALLREYMPLGKVDDFRAYRRVPPSRASLSRRTVRYGPP